MPNAAASLALLAWPFVTWALVARAGAWRGVALALLGGYLLLPPAPAGLDLPLLPPLTKDSVPSLSALAALLLARGGAPSLLPEEPLARAGLLGLVALPFATVLANGDPVAWGGFALPALRLREGVGIVLGQAVLILPFLLGRALLAAPERQAWLLRALLGAGLAYSAPMLVEVRLSPQINVWVYGYFQHDFSQMMRGGGFRPIVFLVHGLWAAFLALTAFAAALALLRDALSRGATRAAVGYGLAALWMLGVLVLCKSMGALLYGLLLLPLLLLLPPRRQVLAAALIALVPVLYPVARSAGLVPAESLVAAAARVSEERANSLRFRLDTEAQLLERAEERPLFGWGLWGRNLIWEPDSGRQLTIPDGRWIILFGVFGWAGYAAAMALLAGPPLLAWARMPAGAEIPAAPAALALILSVNLADLVPNATDTPLTWLMAGTLLGWAERQRASRARAARAPAFRTVL